MFAMCGLSIVGVVVHLLAEFTWVDTLKEWYGPSQNQIIALSPNPGISQLRMSSFYTVSWK
jgi:hypothetical protein